jgi:hypothetical protein
MEVQAGDARRLAGLCPFMAEVIWFPRLATLVALVERRAFPALGAPGW